MFGKVYKLTNATNNKIYIGQTTSDLDRYIDSVLHKKKFNNNRLLDRAIQKYGPDCWVYEVIATAKSREELDSLEMKYISEYDSRNTDVGYNICRGGERGPGWPKGNKYAANFSDSVKQRISKNVSKALKGKPKSEAHKRAMSLGRTGAKNHMTGRKQSPDTIAKMKATASGRKLVNNKWLK